MLVVLLISLAVAAGLFAIYVWLCAWEISKVDTEIKRALENLKATGDFNAIDEADAVFARNERLASVWKNFRGTLTQTRDGIFSSTDAAEFFSPQNFTRDMNMTFWQSYGGIFTGLGIWGTFLGLTLSLQDLDITSGDIETLKDGIANLLSGVETAFVTSLVGISAGLLYSWVHHLLMKDFQEKVQNLANALDKKFPCKIAETWLADNLQETRDQTLTVKDIGEKISETICDRLAEKLEELSQNICEAVGKIGNNAVGKAITDNAKPELKNFTNALDNFSTTAGKLSNDLTAVTNSNTEQISEAVKAFSKIVEAHNKTMKDTFTRIEKLLSSTESFLNRVEAAGNSLTKAADPVKQSSELLKTHLAETTQAAEKFRNEMAARMKNLADENQITRENISALSTVVQNFKGVATELERSTKIIRDSLDGYNTTMSKELANALKNFDDSMSSALGGLNEAIESFSEAVGYVKQQQQKRR